MLVVGNKISVLGGYILPVKSCGFFQGILKAKVFPALNFCGGEKTKEIIYSKTKTKTSATVQPSPSTHLLYIRLAP